eukprot:UN03608
MNKNTKPIPVYNNHNNNTPTQTLPTASLNRVFSRNDSNATSIRSSLDMSESRSKVKFSVDSLEPVAKRNHR